jgi:branched-chain amino acid transport system ATP-binding protein
VTFFVVEDLSIRFGGIRAIAQLSLTLEQGGIYGLIGPNGAGKTSLINAITGLVAIADGRIILDGAELQDLPAHRIAAAGVGRTFQHAEPLADQTVLENLRTGGYAHRGSALLQDLLGMR